MGWGGDGIPEKWGDTGDQKEAGNHTSPPEGVFGTLPDFNFN